MQGAEGDQGSTGCTGSVCTPLPGAALCGAPAGSTCKGRPPTCRYPSSVSVRKEVHTRRVHVAALKLMNQPADVFVDEAEYFKFLCAGDGRIMMCGRRKCATRHSVVCANVQVWCVGNCIAPKSYLGVTNLLFKRRSVGCDVDQHFKFKLAWTSCPKPLACSTCSKPSPTPDLLTHAGGRLVFVQQGSGVLEGTHNMWDGLHNLHEDAQVRKAGAGLNFKI